jgi:hypothetical protein
LREISGFYAIMHPKGSQRTTDYLVDVSSDRTGIASRKETHMADVQIEDGIIKVVQLDIQDPKAAAVLAEYPQVRWPEITRRAMKIGLGYLKGGGKD